MPAPNPSRLTVLPRIARKVRKRAQRFWHKAQGKRSVHFLHLGKTGGSAIKYAIEQCPDPHARYVVYLHRHEKRLRDVPEQEQFFFFLRDPVSRFVSGFYSRQRQGQPRYFQRWTPGEEAAFRQFGTPSQLALALSSTRPEERDQAERAMRSIFHVKDSYLTWFESREYFMSRVSDLFFIGFQEQLSDDFTLLKLKLGLPGLKLPDDDIGAHRNPANLDKSLEDRAVANLKHWYADDFAFIDLCKRILRDNEALRAASPDDLVVRIPT